MGLFRKKVKWYKVDWHTAENTAGGTGQIGATSVEDAIKQTRKLLRKDLRPEAITDEQIENAIIEATEVTVNE